MLKPQSKKLGRLGSVTKHQVKRKMKKKLDLKALHNLEATRSSLWSRGGQRVPNTAASTAPWFLIVFNQVDKKVNKVIWVILSIKNKIIKIYYTMMKLKKDLLSL